MVRGLLKKIPPLTIRRKLIFSMCAGTLFTAFLTSTIIFGQVSKLLQKELINKGMIIAADLATQSVAPIMYDDLWAIFRSVKSVAAAHHMPGLEYVMVLDNEGRVLAHSDPLRFRAGEPMPDGPFNAKALGASETIVQELPLSGETKYDITAPSKMGTRTLGFVRVGLTDSLVRNELAAVKKNIYFIAIILSMGGIVVAVWVAYRITGPLQRVTQNIVKISQGHIRDVFPIEVFEKDEVGTLVNIFNEMAKSLKNQREMDEYIARKDRLAMLGEFSAGLAHEIKNPLTSMKMLMQSAIEKDLPLCIKDTEIIEQEINRIDRIVREFLLFARPAEEEYRSTDVNAVLREALALIKPEMKKSRIELVEELSETIGDVMARRAGLREVVLNVMLNAVQAMGHGGVLTAQSFQAGDQVAIIISDTGPGIDAGDLKYIFDPFFTKKAEGTGMGLAITDRIIREHRGRIDVDTSAGKGTTISIVLPIL